MSQDLQSFVERAGLSSELRASTPAPSPELDFLLRAAELLHAYGTPAHRLEETLSSLALRIGVRSHFFSTPTSFLAAFGDGSAQRVNLLRVQPGKAALEKLVLFDRAIAEVEAGRLSPAQGLERLNTIASAPRRFGPAWGVLAFGCSSTGAAVLFRGGWNEVWCSLVLGLGCGILAHLTARSTRLSRVFEPTASFLAAFLAVAAARYFSPLSDRIVTLAGLIVLLPGLSLTVAMSELATRHLVSGTTRFMGSVTVFLTIAFGVAFGRRLGELAFGIAAEASTSATLPTWSAWPALALSTTAFVVLFEARPKDALSILITGFLGYQASRSGSSLLGPELGAFAGALVVAMVSNLLARLARRPAAVTQVPGILLLVPGSIGYQSLSFFIAHDVLSGMESAFRTSLTAMALVGGLLFANVLLPPRRTL